MCPHFFSVTLYLTNLQLSQDSFSYMSESIRMVMSNSTTPLVTLIHSQSQSLADNTLTKQFTAKTLIKNRKTNHWESTASDICSEAPANLQYAMSLALENGASSWLTALPIEEHRFALHKGAFCDALALHYAWQPSHLPCNCACRASFTVEHALSCSRGGFDTLWHNDIRDLAANMLAKVCHEVGTEAAFTRIRFRSKTNTFLSVLASRLHQNGENAYRKRRLLNPET